jgi:hypothetical protein
MLTGIVPGRLKKLNADASLPEAGGHRIIVNFVSTSGNWPESEFCKNLEKRWSASKSEYRRGYHGQRYFKLGMLQEVNIRSDMTVANVLVYELDDSQEETLNEEALKTGLKNVADLAKYNGSSVHIHKDEYWDKMAELVDDAIIKKGINVTLYGPED